MDIKNKGYYNEDINCYNRVIIDDNNKVRFKVENNIITEVDTNYVSNKDLISDCINELFNFILNRTVPTTPQLFSIHLWDLGYTLDFIIENLDKINRWIIAISTGYPTLLMVDLKYDNEEYIQKIYKTYVYLNTEYKNFLKYIKSLENWFIIYELLITNFDNSQLDEIIPNLFTYNNIYDMVDVLDYYIYS